jgi:hypothetical protein
LKDLVKRKQKKNVAPEEMEEGNIQSLKSATIIRPKMSHAQAVESDEN